MGASKDNFYKIVQAQRESLTGTLPGESITDASIRRGGVPLIPKRLLKLTGDDINEFCKAIVAEVQDGNEDALEMLICIKKGIRIFELLDENIRPIVYGKNLVAKGGILKLHNVEVEPAELGTKWYFDRCGDAKLNTLNQELEAAKQKVTDRQNELKVITTISEQVDTDTGETWKVNPPIKRSTSGYKVTIK